MHHLENDLEWTERLVQNIEMRPALYDKSLKEYSDRHTNKEKWAEVCREMFENWDQLSSEEQTIKAKELQQRWRNLRTCFKRELNKQHQINKSGQKIKRRKYIYFDLLSFLLPIINNRDSESSSDANLIFKEEIEEDEELINEEDYIISEDPQEPEEPQRSTVKRLKRNMQASEEPSLNVLEQREETDEDRLFLLSLVPSFKRLNEDQKLDAKMEFLQVLKRVKNAPLESNERI